MGLTNDFAEYVASLSYRSLPDDVVAAAKDVLLDTVGVAVRGSWTEHGRISTDYAAGNPGDACSLLGGGSATPRDAALANGICAHAIDFDDTHDIIHPACSIVPAALSAAERADATGRDLLTGIVCGYDVTTRVARALNPAHRRSGYHPTGTLNGLGAAAAVASVTRMSAPEVRNAIAIAADQAAGTTAYHYSESMMKHFHGGRPARDGVVSADLAARGYVGDDEAIDGPDGLADVLADGEDIADIAYDLGDRYEVARTSLKPYPACRHTNGPIDAAVELHERLDSPPPESIEHITLEIYALAAELFDKPRPESHIRALLSLQYTVVTGLLRGNVTLDGYEAGFYKDPEHRRLMEEMEMVVDERYTQRYPAEWPSTVRVELSDGREASATVTHPRGSPENPLSREELEAKFERVTSPVLGPASIDDAIDHVRDLEAASGQELMTPFVASN